MRVHQRDLGPAERVPSSHCQIKLSKTKCMQVLDYNPKYEINNPWVAILRKKEKKIRKEEQTNSYGQEIHTSNVDNYVWGSNNFSPFKYVLHGHSDFLPKGSVWKAGKMSNFIAEKPGKHYFSQLIKVTMSRDKYYWYNRMKMVLSPV